MTDDPFFKECSACGSTTRLLDASVEIGKPGFLCPRCVNREKMKLAARLVREDIERSRKIEAANNDARETAGQNAPGEQASGPGATGGNGE